MTSLPFVVAIDGPSGVGKGTVARAVAARLGFRHVDTGAMYRAVAWKALADGIPLDAAARIATVARAAVFDLESGVRIDGIDVTDAIRTPAIDRAATAVARLPEVRAELVVRQRALRREPGIVMEGRDIGSVVFPNADLKIYLDATPEERARRRALDPAHGGPVPHVGDIALAMEARDRQDRTRQASPLAVAPDAVVIDTTSLNADEVVARVLALVSDRLTSRA